MEWLFATAVLVLFVYHRTFRVVVSLLVLLAGLGLGLVLLVTSGVFAWKGWPPIFQGSLICLVALWCGWFAVKLFAPQPLTAPLAPLPSPTLAASPPPARPAAPARQSSPARPH